MVLMRVDLPQPFGPRMQTCSPEPILSEMSWRAARSPRMTVTWLRARSGALGDWVGWAAVIGMWVVAPLAEGRLRVGEHSSLGMEGAPNLGCEVVGRRNAGKMPA